MTALEPGKSFSRSWMVPGLWILLGRTTKPSSQFSSSVLEAWFFSIPGTVPLSRLRRFGVFVGKVQDPVFVNSVSQPVR